MNKFLFYSITAIAIAGIIGSSAVYAAGPARNAMHSVAGGPKWTAAEKPIDGKGYGFENMLQNKADILGISIDDLRQQLEDGKNFAQIAEEKGITAEQMRAAMLEKMTERLQEMVDNGTITQEQMNERLQWMENKPMNCLNGNGVRNGWMNTKGMRGMMGVKYNSQ